MKRRNFIQYLTLSGIASLFPAKLFARTGQDFELFSRPGLLGILNDEALVGRLGMQYLEANPELQNADALVHILKEKVGSLPGSESVSARFKALVSSDFESGATQIIEGFVLSETEVQQSALFALWG